MRNDIDIIKQYIDASISNNHLLMKAIEAVHSKIKNIDLTKLTGEEKDYILSTHSPNTLISVKGEIYGTQIS